MTRIPVDEAIPQEVLSMEGRAILEIRPAGTGEVNEVDGGLANVRS